MQDLMLQVGPLIPALRRYARALLHERAAADDLVQDCLERVIGRWHQRHPDGAVRTWVFAILHNLAMNRLQQSRRRGPHLALEDADEAAAVSPPAQEHALRHGELLRALATLPEEQRSVLLLVSVEDFSYAEAAHALDIPLGTVMSRLARARDKLQRAMDGETPAAAPRPALRRIK